jgi:hypothetical protein
MATTAFRKIAEESKAIAGSPAAALLCFPFIALSHSLYG